MENVIAIFDTLFSPIVIVLQNFKIMFLKIFLIERLCHYVHLISNGFFTMISTPPMITLYNSLLCRANFAKPNRLIISGTLFEEECDEEEKERGPLWPHGDLIEFLGPH